MGLSAVSKQADRKRLLVLPCVHGQLQCLVQIARLHVAITGLHASVDSLLIALYGNAHAAVHRDSKRLSASHTSEAAREDHSSLEGSPEVLSSTVRERFVSPLQDPLCADVSPSPCSHLAIHDQALCFEFVKHFPGRPSGHEMSVRNQDSRGEPGSFEDSDRFPGLY